MVIVAGSLLSAERMLAEHAATSVSEATPELVLYAVETTPPAQDLAYYSSSDDFDGGMAGAMFNSQVNMRVRWVFSSPGSGWTASHSVFIVMLQLAGLLLLAMVLRKLGVMRQPLDARLRPTPSLPAFFSCCAIAALLPQLMLLRHEYGSSSSLAIAGAATLIYASAWMAARRLQLWRALQRVVSLGKATVGDLIYEPLRLVRLEGDLVRLTGEHYERSAMVEFADGRLGRVQLEEAELDGDACAEVVRLAQRGGQADTVWVAGVLDETTASADAAEPLCREVATERKLVGPLLLLGGDRASMRHQLACELLILASTATLACAFLLSRSH